MRYPKALLPVVLSFLMLGAGCSLTHTVVVNGNANSSANGDTNSVANVNAAANTNAKANVNSAANASVTYQGQSGKNALELLQVKHKVDVSSQGFVNAIDDVKPGDRQFWAFYVNNKQADVGAKDYKTTSSDKIEWKLESY